jgi:hypothetical protein
VIRDREFGVIGLLGLASVSSTALTASFTEAADGDPLDDLGDRE